MAAPLSDEVSSGLVRETGSPSGLRRTTTTNAMGERRLSEKTGRESEISSGLSWVPTSLRWTAQRARFHLTMKEQSQEDRECVRVEALRQVDIPTVPSLSSLSEVGRRSGASPRVIQVFWRTDRRRQGTSLAVSGWGGESLLVRVDIPVGYGGPSLDLPPPLRTGRNICGLCTNLPLSQRQTKKDLQVSKLIRLLLRATEEMVTPFSFLCCSDTKSPSSKTSVWLGMGLYSGVFTISWLRTGDVICNKGHENDVNGVEKM